MTASCSSVRRRAESEDVLLYGIGLEGHEWTNFTLGNKTPMAPGILRHQVEDVLVLDYGDPTTLRVIETEADIGNLRAVSSMSRKRSSSAARRASSWPPCRRPSRSITSPPANSAHV